MKQLWFVLAAALLANGCASDSSQAPAQASGSSSNPDKISGLSLALTSTDSQGRLYRLRNASFTVDFAYYYYGYDSGVPVASTVLSTETDPDSDRLSVRLTPGSYSVSLGGDWYIERLTANGPERVQQVVLLSDALQYTYVSEGWNYDLQYHFGVDGTLIDFRHGDLGIDVVIELPGDDGGVPSYPGYPGDASVEGLDASPVGYI